MRDVMRFREKEKLCPRFIGPFDILEKFGDFACWITLPPYLSVVHLVFYVLMLK